MSTSTIIICHTILSLLLLSVSEQRTVDNENSITEQFQFDQDELEYVLLNNNSPCRRACQENSPPMVCKYHFVVEWYYTMSKACYNCPYNITDCYRPDCIAADGIRRAVVTINRKIPGMFIEVCKGDLIVVDVENELNDESTTIHWHGQHQMGTPYMDGVPSITQCGILPKTSFRYEFRAQQSGTHFWHSHIGFQRGDGAFGGLTVRVPASMDPHAHLYDYDLSKHQMIILDWEHQVGVQRFQAHHHSFGDNKPPGMLINGHGRYAKFATNETDQFVYTPIAKFDVEPGYRYRFRIINAGYLNCPIEMSIDNHTLTVISSDGSDIEPVQVTSVVTYAGERFDFIINTDQMIENYWMRFKGLMDCDERFTKTHEFAILHYDGAPIPDDFIVTDHIEYENMHNEGIQLNALNVPENDTNTITMAEVKSMANDSAGLDEVPDVQYYIEYDFYAKDNPHFHRKNKYGFNEVPKGHLRVYTPQLNHITMKIPPFPILPARDLLTPNMTCNESTVVDCETKFCECSHVYNVPLNSSVELILVDRGFTYNANHPFHLHGHYFRVVAMNKLGENTTVEDVKEQDRLGLIRRNLKNPPYKDTVTVPDGGYTVVRFYANNPGYWIFHCHIEWHVEVGMALVFKVGEHSQFPPVPDNFPTCYNKPPTVSTTTTTTTTTTTKQLTVITENQNLTDNIIIETNNSSRYLHHTWWPFYNNGNHLSSTSLVNYLSIIILLSYII